MNKPDFQKGVRVILSGTTNWAQLTPTSGPNKMSGKFQTDLLLDDASVKELDSLGITKHVVIKNQEGQPKYDVPAVRLKANNPPTMFDTSKQTFDDYINNGSTIRAACLIKAWEKAGKKGLSVYINQGVVLSVSERGDSPATDALFEGVQTTPATSSSNEIANDDLPF
jgi:hypothetical protein